MAKEVRAIRENHLRLLGRYPSSAEITYWLHFFAAGGTLEELRQDLVRTNEFSSALSEQFRARHRRAPLPAELVELREKAAQPERAEP